MRHAGAVLATFIAGQPAWSADPSGTEPERPSTATQAGTSSPCLAPAITYDVLHRFGLVGVSIRTPCRGGQDATLEYGGATLVVPLSADGRATAVVDAFAGASDVLRIRFADRTEVMRAMPPAPPSLTKIAILWDDPVDLDLHAFEFAAAFGSNRHIWPGRTLRPDDPAATGLRGGGLMTTTGKGNNLGTNTEVYTFVHGDGPGIIRFAIDYVDRGDTAGPGRCGEAPLAAIRFRFVVMEANAIRRRGEAEIGAAPCGANLPPAARYTTKLLPEVRTTTP